MKGVLQKLALAYLALALGVGMLALCAGLLVAVGWLFLPLLLLAGLAGGWVMYAYLCYRNGRRDEFLQLLVTMTEAGLPLQPALEAYLRDRPADAWRRFWDRKIERLADLLEDGVPLPEALRRARGVVSPTTVLAATVGETTGRLGPCLRRSTQGRLAPVWMDTLPRLIYPLVLLLFVASVSGFWMTFILPRMMRIYKDFGMDPPATTQHLVTAAQWLGQYWWLVILLVLAGLAVGAVLMVSSRARWFCPGVGRVYRLNSQGGILKLLSVLLEAGRPAPEALGLLAAPGDLSRVVRRRLDAARLAVERGEPLADSLRRGGLLPRSAVPLVRAAERAHNLPWALGELGDLLAGRAVRFAQRVSVVLFSAAVVATGVLVGFIAVGMFLPLVRIMTELA